MTWPIWAWVASLYWRQNSMMFTPCCPRAVPTGGAGVACPALIWSFTSAEIFLRLRGAACATSQHLLRSRRPLGLPQRSGGLRLRHLVEGQLDRGLPVEDVHHHLELGLLHVDLRNGPGEVGERAGDDPHHVALLPFQPVLRLDLGLLLHRQDLLHLPMGERRGLGPGPARH